MKLRTGFTLLVTGVLLQVAASHAFAQVVITRWSDSTAVNAAPAPVVAPATKTTGRTTGFLSTWDKPAKAAIYSALVPGLGQIYNGAWWKAPVVYATGGVLGYYLVDNNRKYQSFREALLIRLDGDPATVDAYDNDPKFPKYASSYATGDRNLRYSRDVFRRYRDMAILFSVLAWGMQVAEAHIHAHMKNFDISENLALGLNPDLIQISSSNTMIPALTFTFNAKVK